MSGEDFSKDCILRGTFAASVIAAGLTSGYYDNLKSAAGSPGGITFFSIWIVIIIIVVVIWLYALKRCKDANSRGIVDMCFMFLFASNLLFITVFFGGGDRQSGLYLSALLVISAAVTTYFLKQIGLTLISLVYFVWVGYAIYICFWSPSDSSSTNLLPNKGLPPPRKGAKVDALALKSQRKKGDNSCFNVEHSGIVHHNE